MMVPCKSLFSQPAALFNQSPFYHLVKNPLAKHCCEGYSRWEHFVASGEGRISI
jgi:hypothetical protein